MSFLFVVDVCFVAVESLLECVFCAADVCFGACRSGDSCFVNYCVLLAVSLEGAFGFVSAVALFVCVVVFCCVFLFCACEYFCIVCSDYAFHVGGAAVAEFDEVSVEYFV